MESRLIFIPEAIKIFQFTSFTNWIFPRVHSTSRNFPTFTSL